MDARREALLIGDSPQEGTQRLALDGRQGCAYGVVVLPGDP